MRVLVGGLAIFSLGFGRPGAVLAQTAAVAPSLVADGASPPSDGETRRFTIVSRLLGETRRVVVALPASYGRSARDHRYPVAIVLDGESLRGPAATVSAELADNGQIPELVIVAIENTNRLRDLTPPGLSVSGSSTREGGDRFLDFIERELLPAVDKQLPHDGAARARRPFVGRDPRDVRRRDAAGVPGRRRARHADRARRPLARAAAARARRSRHDTVAPRGDRRAFLLADRRVEQR
jgi:hypothetical protein